MNQDTPPNDTARRRELIDAIGKASELHHHLLLVLAVLIGAQGVAAAINKGDNVLIFVSLALSVLALGARLWVLSDLLASLRMRLRPLLEGEGPTPDAKTRRELEWLTEQDPLLDRASLWAMWLSAALFAAGCVV